MKNWKTKINWVLTGLVFLNLVLYLPSLFTPLSYGDECIYLTLGQAFRKGMVFYRDIHDNKPPLLYLVAGLANGRLFYFRLISILWNLIHLVIFYKLVRLVTKKRYTPLISSLVFTILLLIFEGRIGNGENFMMMPVTLAVYLTLKRKKRNFRFSFLIGILFSIGFLFKIPVVFDLTGILFGILFLSLKKVTFKKFLAVFKKSFLWGTLSGFAIPILLSILYYYFKGGIVPYVRSALLQNIGYLASWQGSNLGLIIRFAILGGVALIAFLCRKKINQTYLVFFSWFTFGLFGAFLSGRPYPHYLIEIVPSLAILLGLTLEKKAFREVGLTTLGVSLLIWGYLHYHFWYYPIKPFYKNFYQYLGGQINERDYVTFWGGQAWENRQLAKFIRQSTSKDSPIFVWGEGSCLYALSRHSPPGRFTVNYHIYDFDGFDETLKALEKKLPEAIIKLSEENRDWPELNKLIQEKYYPFLLPQINDEIFLLREPLK